MGIISVDGIDLLLALLITTGLDREDHETSNKMPDLLPLSPDTVSHSNSECWCTSESLNFSYYFILYILDDSFLCPASYIVSW